MVVGITFIAIIAAMVIQFRGIIGPLLLAFILTYLLYPVAEFLSRISRISWRASVNLIFW
jgi:predicted PurR-regulated permease PerM